MENQATWLERDQRFMLHPLHHPAAHQAPLIIESGQGIYLRTVEGKEYIDGLAGLWNVLIGHGNEELAEAARAQMAQLAFCSNYAGTSNLPAIALAHKVAGFAYPNLNFTYFTSGGAEANERLTRTKGESLLLAPPLVIREAEIDRILAIVGQAIECH